MSRYKVGDKVVAEIEKAALTNNGGGFYIVLDYMQSAISVDEKTEPLSTYTEPLEAKIRRQAAEITRLLAENKELKNEKQELTRERNQLMGRCGGLSAAKIKAFNNGRLAGQNEAWELAKKIVDDVWNGGYSEEKLKQIFGYAISQLCIVKNTYQEAAAKVAERERAKEEIKVGDIYKNIEGSCFVICDVNEEDNNAQVLWSSSLSSRKTLDEITRCYTKTGRHIDIDSFLKQIGGAE